MHRRRGRPSGQYTERNQRIAQHATELIAGGMVQKQAFYEAGEREGVSASTAERAYRDHRDSLTAEPSSARRSYLDVWLEPAIWNDRMRRIRPEPLIWPDFLRRKT